MTLSRLLVVVVLVALATSCSSAPPVAPVAPIETGAEQHPADQIAAARRLPREMTLVAVTDDFGGLLQKAGRSELISRFRPDYERAVFDVVKELGYNIFSPEAVADLGVDMHGQAGIGLYQIRQPEPWPVLFFTLDKPERFKNLMYMIANGHVGRKRMGLVAVDHGVMVSRHDVAIVMVDDTAIVILGRRCQNVGERFLRLEPEETLAQHRPFRIAMRGLEEADVRAYVNPRVALYAEARVDVRWPGATGEAVKANIEQQRSRVLRGARDRGASPAQLVRLDEKYGAALTNLRTEPFQEKIRSLFGELGGVGVAVNITPRSLDVKGHLDAGDTFLKKLFVARNAAPPLVAGLDGQPAMMLGLSLDLPTLVTAARALGAPIAEANVLIGADMESDLLPLLSGEIAVYASAPEGGLAAVKGIGDMELGLLLGVADAKKIDDVLTKFVGRGDGASSLSADGPRRWKMQVEGYPQLTLTLSEAHLVLATDPELAARVADGGKAPSGARAWQLATAEGNAAELFAQAAALLGSWLMFDEAGVDAEPPPLERLPWHDPRVQFSEAYAAKMKELHALDVEATKLISRRNLRERGAMVRAADPLGAIGIRLIPTEHGLSAVGSYRTKGRSVASIVAAMQREKEGKTPHEDDTKLSELETQRRKLHKELEAIYKQLPKPEPKGEAKKNTKAKSKKESKGN